MHRMRTWQTPISLRVPFAQAWLGTFCGEAVIHGILSFAGWYDPEGVYRQWRLPNEAGDTGQWAESLSGPHSVTKAT